MKGKTKSGIVFSIDERVKDDVRLVYLMAEVQKNGNDELKAMQNVGSILGLLFGSEEEVMKFMNEIAVKNNGICTASSLIDEITDILNSIKSKN